MSDESRKKGDAGNNASSGGRSGRKRGGRGGRGGEGRPPRHAAQGGDPSERKGEGAGRSSGRRRDGAGRSAGGGRREEPEAAALEYVLIGENGCLAAAVYRSALPLRWRAIEAVQLLKPGLYLRRAGALKLVARELRFEKAVMFALWEDPLASYRTDDGRWVRPGIHCGFLVRSPLDEGPPWLPLIAEVDATPAEYEAGLLSPWLDQVSAVRFTATLTQQGERLKLSSSGSLEEEAGTEAMRDVMRWLAENPQDESPAADAARRVLVENGHGLQRLGLTLMHEPPEACGALVREVLGPLAPVAAPLLSALHDLWTEEERDEALGRARVRAVAEALNPMLRDDHPAQAPETLAVLTTWITGLFGARPERNQAQPARSLFAIAQFLRSIRRSLELFDHPDAEVPTFPLDRPAGNALARALSWVPPQETNLERLLRALAIAEAGWEFARPTLQHLRPFRIAFPWLQNYPIAGRTLLGRHDYLLTGWSFRGAEVRSGRADARQLQANLILDAPTVATCRALARTLGSHGAIREALATTLREAPHPLIQAVGALPTQPAEARLEAYREAAAHPRITRHRLFEAVSTAEFLLAAADRGEDPAWLLAPVAPEAEGSAVRGHFMYWRMFCRSVHPAAAERYIAFVEEMLPQLDALPTKLQTELFVLMRMVDLDAERRDRWAEVLAGRAEALFSKEAGHPGGERLWQLLGTLGQLDPARWLGALPQVVRDPRIAAADLSRILEVTRRVRSAELRSAPLFREMHSRLCAPDRNALAAARTEWVRSAISGSRRSGAVTWLLDARRHAPFVGSEVFSSWFISRGLSLIDAPEEGALELLEIALVGAPEEDVDLIVSHLRQRTTWPVEEIGKLLLQKGRPVGALEWMIASPAGSAAEADPLLEAQIREARSGRLLRRGAARLVRCRRRFRAELPASAAALDDALQRYRPQRKLPEGLDRALEALRLAEPPAGGAAEQALLGPVLAWRGDRARGGAFSDFLRWCVERSLGDAMREPLAAWIHGGSAPSLQGASSLLSPALRSALTEGDDGLGEKELAGLLRGKVAVSALDASLHRVLRELSAEMGAGTLAAALEKLDTAALREVSAPKAESTDVPQQTPAEAPPQGENELPREAGAATQSRDAALAGEGDDDATVASAGEADATAGSGDGEGSDAASRRGKASGSGLDRAVSASITDSIERVFGTWKRLLAPCADVGADPLPLDLLEGFCPTPLMLRRHVLVLLSEEARSCGVKVRDEDRLLTSDVVDLATVDVDPEDLRCIVEEMLAISGRHGLVGELSLERGHASLSLVPGRDNSEGSTGPNVGAEDEAGRDETPEDEVDDLDDSAQTESAEISAEDGDDGEAEVADDGDDDASGDEGSDDGGLVTALRSLFREDGTPEDSERILGHPGRSVLLRTLLARNRTLSLRTAREAGTPVLQLIWQGGGRSGGGRRQGRRRSKGKR